MFKKFILPAFVILVPVGTYVYHKIHQHIIMDMFPQIDREVAKKAYNMMILRALRGDYADVDMDNNKVMRGLFYDNVEKVYAR